MEKMKESKWLYILLSFVAAFFLWLTVGSENGQEEINIIRNIPVVYTNIDALEERGLMISEGAEQTLDLEIKATRSVALKLMEKGAVSAVVDVSKVTSAGSYTTGYQLNTPNSVVQSSFSIVGSMQNISYTVARRSDREVEIRGLFNGEVADGFQLGEFSITPGSITISGEEANVNKVDHAQVVITRDDEPLSATYTGTMPFQLIGFDGQVLDMDALHLTANVDTVDVTLPVVKLKEIPLTVDILDGGGAAQDDVDIEISPRTITVSGDESALDSVEKIVLGQVDLQKVFTQDSLTFPIDVGTELENVSGVSEATVTVKIRGLTTRTLEVDDIQFINVPDGYTAEAVTLSIQVQVRGREDAVSAVIPSQLRAVADLKDAGRGSQTVPVKVYLDGSSDVGVVGTDYKIVVNVKRA
ncbi:YbbR-like domain-containing protein [Pseudoflavonifractor sp. MSJ-37]|uniref:CdaR family protein n=1 Tax=Pseudoflavonifractor sp. MSJ-37 TaxID=2841531 RepID=UPI001C10D957|nr:CdaR family protein [Pseudoflavonifractor sp. MSJ-37]MBU5434799.1 hypothetical protein [Pseudoflavonifractor sp. MSJ-37]